MLKFKRKEQALQIDMVKGNLLPAGNIMQHNKLACVSASRDTVTQPGLNPNKTTFSAGL